MVKGMAVPFTCSRRSSGSQEAAGAPELDVETVAVPVQGPDADGVLGDVRHLLRHEDAQVVRGVCQGLAEPQASIL